MERERADFIQHIVRLSRVGGGCMFFVFFLYMYVGGGAALSSTSYVAVAVYSVVCVIHVCVWTVNAFIEMAPR